MSAENADHRIELSDSAITRVAVLLREEGGENLMLRIAVQGGGCSGFQYGFSFDDAINPDDKVFEKSGVRTVIDEASLEILDGSVIDYVEDLIGSAFRIVNPNFTASCGCGSSFAV
jgi:iron-sulfur cluster insertion protein